jgi:ubiquinone/menaquinone biosynthesis C-methylase UbiE
MSNLPAGSLRDTPHLAHRYSQTSHWQRERGRLLIDVAAPQAGERVVDLGCGTGELSGELARRVGPTGRVVGLDPNPARLQQAETTVGPEHDNLTFTQANAEDLAFVPDGSVDLVYSNYAIHWVLEQEAMMAEVRRVLRPGGRFVAEFLSEPIPFFLTLIRMMPDGEAVEGENCFLEEAAWRTMIAARGFEILRFERPQFTLRYEDLPTLFDWLAATSHGAFDAERLPAAARRDLERRYPGEIACQCNAFRLALAARR